MHGAGSYISDKITNKFVILIKIFELQFAGSLLGMDFPYR